MGFRSASCAAQLLCLCRHRALSCSEPLCSPFCSAAALGGLGGAPCSCWCWCPVLGVAECRALCHTGGKKVLLVGARGAEGAALQSVLQRRGAAVLSCHWEAPQLQSEVSALLSAWPHLHPHYLLIPASCPPDKPALSCRSQEGDSSLQSQVALGLLVANVG